eukprot:GHVU01087424.1.p1 GENE.GHVU01087424.1~~GHVU01087424.1.p1  ORF type:complete len:315 (-),score=35.25 GHVU01087424.1:30-974(-)
MDLKSKKIMQFLQEERGRNGAGARNDDDIAFAIFLEPPDSQTSESTTLVERTVEKLIEAFSQKPTMVHVELVLPPFLNRNSTEVQFATYMGATAAFQTDVVSGIDFYLIKNGQRWRCLPVFGKHLVSKLRAACVSNVGARYSLVKYPTSSHIFRKYSWIWADGPGYSGHCATITARVLQAAQVKAVFERPPWYSPSSLFLALKCQLRGGEDKSGNKPDEPDNPDEPENVKDAIDSILHGPLSPRTFEDLGPALCEEAIRALAARVTRAARGSGKNGEDGVGNANFAARTERELADALLKFVLVGHMREANGVQD